MVDDIFLASDVAGGPVILGFRLRPLSIWHVWALSALESPYVLGGNYGVEDVVNCLLFCTQTRESYNALALTCMEGAVKGEIAAAYLEADKDGRFEAEKQLAAYFGDCTVFPEFWQDSKTDPVKDRLRCPGEWHLVATLLQMRICQTETEAWDYPIARARCWQAVESERQGGSSYMDKRDRDDLKQLEQMQEEAI